MNIRKRLKGMLPNTHARPLMITSVRDNRPDPRSWMRAKFIQIIGGKRWSLAIVKSGEVQNERTADD